MDRIGLLGRPKSVARGFRAWVGWRMGLGALDVILNICTTKSSFCKEGGEIFENDKTSWLVSWEKEPLEGIVSAQGARIHSV